MDTIRKILNECEIHIDDIDRSFDSYKIQQFLDGFDSTVKEVFQEIISQTQYIPFKQFVHEIQSIAKKINIDNFSIYIDINDPCHSEVWCLTLVWHIIKDHVKYIFTSIDKITNEYPILLIDDCIYSGVEMYAIIQKINNIIPGNLHFYICSPYASTKTSLLISGLLRGTFVKDE